MSPEQRGGVLFHARLHFGSILPKIGRAGQAEGSDYGTKLAGT
jgi:hypothetical protein